MYSVSLSVEVIYSSDNTRERIFILTNKRKSIKRESESVCVFEQSRARESKRTETFLFSFSAYTCAIIVCAVVVFCLPVQSVLFYFLWCESFFIYSFFFGDDNAQL